MGKPIAPKKEMGLAFPDVCLTPGPPSGPVPIPYPNMAQFSDATGVSDESGKELLVKGQHVLLNGSIVSSSTGDEAGSSGGVRTGAFAKACKVVQASASVLYGPDKKGLARLLDQTKQNIAPGTESTDGGEMENASGFVLSAEPTVLVGD